MFPGFDLMLKTLSPQKGFSLVKVHLENELKMSLKKYELIFDAVNRKVNYNVYSEQFENGVKNFPFDKGEKFIDVALHYLSTQIPEGSTVDKALCQYEEMPDNTVTLIGYLFFTAEGVKQSYKHVF